MAESSKKHSRKSKLVPREYIEIDDDVPTGAELEEAVQSIPTSEQSTSLLPKIKNTIDEDSFKETSLNPVELDVQVQVESCSDDDAEPNLYNDDDDEKYLQEHIKILSKLPKKEIVIYPDTIRKVVDLTANKIRSVADRQLDIYIRNSLWRFMKMVELDYYEQLLQEVLSQWRVWNGMSKMRSYILAFKCNICYQGWWHLQPFEDHIRIHKTVTLQLDTYHHDCVITAAAGDWYESVCQVYIEGNCPRCLNDFESHMKPIRQTMYYNCKACFERFPTCQRMFNHEGVCVRYGKMAYNNLLKHDERWHCQLCNIECLSEERHFQHFLGCHSVRSDEPVTMPNHKDCYLCGMKYFTYNLHSCPKRSDNFKCTYCFRKFQNKFVQEIHENSFNSSCYCPVCNRLIKKQCMLYEHLVQHSKYYLIAYKCQECADCVLVASDALLAGHRSKYHKRKHDKKYFNDMLIVPKQCLTLKFHEAVTVPDMILEKKKPPPKKEGSDQDMLKTLSKVMQVRQEYEQNAEKEREGAQQLVHQEQQNKVVKNISKELANKFLKRANNLQVVAWYDSGVASAPDSPEFDNNDKTDIDIDKTDFADELNSDDDLRIDDDDIGETESSVNALLNQFKMKKEMKEEIDIEEPDLSHYMVLGDSQEDFNVNDNDNSRLATVDNTPLTTDAIKNEFLCNETTESDDMYIESQTMSIKQEKIDSPLTVTEESQDSDCIEVRIPDTQTNNTEENYIDLETNVVIKTEPMDDDEVKIFDIQTNNTKDYEMDLETNVVIKTEPIDDDEVKIFDIQTNITKDYEMDLETNVVIKTEPIDDDEVKIFDIQTNITKDYEMDLETNVIIKTKPMDNDEVQIPDRQTNNTKDNKIDLETNVVIKTEPIDNYEFGISESTPENVNNSKELEKVTPKTENVIEKLSAQEESVVEKLPAEEESEVEKLPAEEESVVEKLPAEEESIVEKLPAEEESVVEKLPAQEKSNGIVIKEEKEDCQEFDVAEDDIDKEQKACLEELSKVFQASNSSKQVELTNICVDEIKVKAEPMDEDEDFEQDMIVTNANKDLDVPVHSESGNAICSDKSTDSVDLSSLEPEVNISESPKTKCTKRKHYNNKRLYSCNRCDFTGEHSKYADHKQSCPKHYNNKRVYSCNKCDFKGEHRKYVDHRQSICPRFKTNKTFEKEWIDLKCSDCDKRFKTLRNYLFHLHKAHNLKQQTCPQCFKEFQNISCTLNHFSAHIKKNFIKIQVLKELSYFSSQSSGVQLCRVCNEEVLYKNFFNHWEKHFDYNFGDDEEKNLVIDESVDEEIGDTSNETVEPSPDIKKILAQLELPSTLGDRDANKQCCVCGRRFDRRNDTKRHLIEHLLQCAYEAPGNGLVCQRCGHVTEKAEAYKVHMRQHGSLPVFRCEMCRKCFSDSSNFAKHKKVHNLQALNCDHCKRKFQSKKQLEIHMELHRTTKPIKCELCERVFPLPSDYKKHMRSTHSAKRGPSYCKVCRQRELTKRALWDHMWLAHNIRHNDADCLVCDKSFRKYNDMRWHMRAEHQLNPSVTIKMLRTIRALSVEERTEKIRELLNTTVTLNHPTSGETFVIYE